MTKHEFASIIFRLLGFYILANNLATSLVSLIPFFSSPQQAAAFEKFKYVIMMPILSYMFFGLVFIIFANYFASFVVKSNEDDKVNFNITAEDLQRSLFSFIGLYFVALSLPKLVSIAVSVLPYERQAYYANPKFTGDLAGSITQLILGVIVFFGSTGLAGMLKILRYSGKSNDNE